MFHLRISQPLRMLWENGIFFWAQQFWALRRMWNTSAFSEQLRIIHGSYFVLTWFCMFNVHLLSFFVQLQKHLFLCWYAKPAQAIYKQEASEKELAWEKLVIENTLRPELFQLWSPEYHKQPLSAILDQASCWSQAKIHYLATKTRHDGLKFKVSQLELVCLV